MPLPFCQRCTGLYVGGLLAAAAWIGWRPRPTARVLWLHGASMLLMIPFGFHLVPQNGEVRTLTGALFSVGLLYFLSLVPAGRMRAWRETGTSSRAAYLAVSLGAGPAVLLAARIRSVAANQVLAWAGAAGFLLLAALALANVALLARGLASGPSTP